ncbi:MAG: transporter, partial [Pseudomonadota bacterium]
MRQGPGLLRFAAPALGLAFALAPATAKAAEGALSHYLPGTAGDLGYALPPSPGFQAVNIVWSQSGSVGAAVVEGRSSVDLDLDLVLDLFGGFYTFERRVLGAAYTVGALVPFGRASLDGEVITASGARVGASADSFALSDIAFVPIQLNWSAGKVHFKVSETVTAPTGGYDIDRFVNLGRNYWSFDTAVAATWFDPAAGREISVQPGLMLNTRNDATDYRTGAEFHVDFA